MNKKETFNHYYLLSKYNEISFSRLFDENVCFLFLKANKVERDLFELIAEEENFHFERRERHANGVLLDNEHKSFSFVRYKRKYKKLNLTFKQFARLFYFICLEYDRKGGYGEYWREGQPIKAVFV